MKTTRTISLMCAAFLLAALPFAGCDKTTSSTDGGSDAVDVPQEQPEVPAGCSAAHDPLNPSMRMTYFDLLLPENLDNQVLENLMIEGFHNGDFIWLLQMTGVDDGTTDSDGNFHLYTGSGVPVGAFPDSNCFRFRGDARWPDAQADMAIAGNDVSWIDAEPKIDIQVPVFKTDPVTHVQNLLLVLPLQDVEIASGTFNADRTAMGDADNCAATNGGVLAGMITVEDAKGVVIVEMGLTLCGLLSGDKGTDLGSPDDDCARDQALWPVPPDAVLDGHPAYRMRACFSAEDVIIVQ
jgi:hypothetical protein